MKYFSGKCASKFLLFALLSALLASSAGAAKPEAVLQIDYSAVKESLSGLIREEMRKNDVMGLSIALVDDQKVVWAQGFGYADENRNIAASPETVYRIGTLTKLFTATTAMQLAEQGQLTLDKPVTTYVPEFSVRTRFRSTQPITPRNLMTHHSGLPSEYHKGMWSRRPELFTTVIPLLKHEYAAYPPDYIFSYSKLGYDLLGRVIERASGQEYALQVQSALLLPLGMRDSGFSPPAQSRLLSRGYVKGAETEEPLLRDTPAGGMYSTVLDVSRFMRMLFANGRSDNKQILNPKALDEMLRPQNSKVPLDLGMRVGLGWMLGGLGEINIQNAGPVAHHAGATLLFRSQMIVLPRHKLGVVVLANSSTAGRAVSRIAAQTMVQALEAKTNIKQPLLEKSPELDLVLQQKIQQDYIGLYASFLGLAEILPKTDRFQVEVLGRTFHLIPRANGNFGIKYAFLGLFPFSLGALEQYEVSQVKIAGHEILKASSQGSELLVAEKIQRVPISPLWSGRVGNYAIENLGNDTAVFDKIRLLHEDGVLLMECSMPLFFKGSFRFPLKPVSDTEAILAGLGRGMGETLRIVRMNGKEKLVYSGYLLGRQE